MEWHLGVDVANLQDLLTVKKSTKKLTLKSLKIEGQSFTAYKTVVEQTSTRQFARNDTLNLENFRTVFSLF